MRFTELVKASGEPEIATLWQDPETDPLFKKAIRENRVLSVRQETVGNKKDFGEIGFTKGRNVSYLIFPKRLPESGVARIVGIKYEMADPGRVTDPVPKKALVSAKKQPVIQQPKPSPEPSTKEFTVTLRKTAIWETTLQVKANSKDQAEEMASKLATEKAHPLSEAVIEVRVRSVTAS